MNKTKWILDVSMSGYEGGAEFIKTLLQHFKPEIIKNLD